MPTALRATGGRVGEGKRDAQDLCNLENAIVCVTRTTRTRPTPVPLFPSGQTYCSTILSRLSYFSVVVCVIIIFFFFPYIIHFYFLFLLYYWQRTPNQLARRIYIDIFDVFLNIIIYFTNKVFKNFLVYRRIA